MTTIIVTVYVANLIIQRKIYIKRTLFDIPILIFLASQIISSVFSIDIHTSLFGFYGRFNGGLLSTLCYIVLYYIFVFSFTSEEFKKYYTYPLLSILLSSIVAILWGLPGWFGHDMSCMLFTGVSNNECWSAGFEPSVRMFSLLGQPNWLGALVSSTFFISLFFLFKNLSKQSIKHTIYTILYSITTVLLFLGILLSRSRSAYLAVIIGLIILFLFFIFKLIKQKQTIIITKTHKIISLTLLVICLLILVIFKTGTQLDTLFLQSNSSSTQSVKQSQNASIPSSSVTPSSDIRTIVWKGALKLGMLYPLFGTGVETFGYSYYLTRPLEHNLTSEWDYLYNKAHNEFLNYFATTGLFGLISYLVFITSVVLIFIKKYRKHTHANILLFLAISYCTIAITNFFGFSTTTMQLLLFLLPAYAVLLYAYKDDQYIEITLPITEKTQKFFFILPAVFCLAGFVFVASYFFADINYNYGKQAHDSGAYQIASTYFQKALSLRNEHVYKDALAYTYGYLSYVSSTTQKDSKEQTTYIDLAKQYSQEAIKDSPKNVLYYRTASKLYYLLYEADKNISYLKSSIEYGNKAIKLAPTDPKLYFSNAVIYSYVYDAVKDEKYMNNAIEMAQKAITLKSNFRDAHLELGRLYKKYGQKDKARESFQYILDNFSQKDQEALQEINSL